MTYSPREQEWIGDAVLLLYARSIMCEDHAWAQYRTVERIVCNEHLAEFAEHEVISGGANEIERQCFRLWLENPELAKAFVKRIVNYFWEKLHVK